MSQIGSSPNFSPGVVIREFDYTAYAPAQTSTRFAVVGGATKGPVDTPTLIGSEADLIRKFGSPVLTDYALHAARQYLAKGAALIFTRVADKTAGVGVNTATALLPGVTGGAPAVAATGSIAFDAGNPVDGHTVTIDDGQGTSVTFEFTDDATVVGGNVAVLIGADEAETALNLLSAIDASLLALTATYDDTTDPTINLVCTIAGTDGNEAITQSGDAPDVALVGMTGGAEVTAGLGSGQVLRVLARTPGTWGNSVEVVIRATETLDAPADHFDLLVYAPLGNSGTLGIVERFHNLSLDPTDATYVETVIEGGSDAYPNASQYIEVDVLDDGVPTPGAYRLGTAGGEVGRDGISGLVAGDYVGSITGQVATGLKALLNPEETDFNVVAVPGVSNTTVIDALLDLCEYRGDCIALIDPPFGLSRDEVVAWHNGESVGIANAPAVPIDSSYGTLNWPWLKDVDPYSKTSIFFPPSGFVAANIAASDDAAGPWFAYAGHNRGVLDADDVEVNPRVDDRDILLGGQNRVNPIVKFQQGGTTLYGNSTLIRTPSAFQQSHVRRMVIHVQRACKQEVKYLVMEPTDPVTWSKYKALCEKVLEGVKADRGLRRFQVICDASTNPPELQRERRMNGKIFLEHIDAAEIVELDFSLFDGGSNFTVNE